MIYMANTIWKLSCAPVVLYLSDTVLPRRLSCNQIVTPKCCNIDLLEQLVTILPMLYHSHTELLTNYPKHHSCSSLFFCRCSHLKLESPHPHYYPFLGNLPELVWVGFLFWEVSQNCATSLIETFIYLTLSTVDTVVLSEIQLG